MSKTSSTDDHLLLFDGHVHIYDCFDLTVFLDSAFRNFKIEAERRAKAGAFSGVLLMTESSGASWFARLQSRTDAESSIDDTRPGPWKFQRTAEDCSLMANRSTGENLILIAGRQIVTAENLEVLALATDRTFNDGTCLENAVNMVKRCGGIPVIPWGTGKWLGKRGAVLTNFLACGTASDIFLGDNSARPVFWRDPAHFKLARSRGIRILPGTDPLPFRSESWRPGSFGFALEGSLGLCRPTDDVKRILLDPSTKPQPYGSLERPHRFLRNQFAMQLRKLRRKHLAK